MGTAVTCKGISKRTNCSVNVWTGNDLRFQFASTRNINDAQAKGENEMIEWTHEPLTEYIKHQSAKQYDDHANRETTESITQKNQLFKMQEVIEWNIKRYKVIK